MAITMEKIRAFEAARDREPLPNTDGDLVREWTEANGHAYKLFEWPSGSFRCEVAIDGPVTPGASFAYIGKGPTPTRAVHDASAYLRRDHGFTGQFSENCGKRHCPYCSTASFPSDCEQGRAAEAPSPSAHAPHATRSVR